MLGVHVAIEGADLGAEDPLVGQLQRIDDGDIEPLLTGGGRELAADPAGPDYRHPTAGRQALPKHVTVSQRP